VDFAARAAVLASVQTPDWESLAQHWSNGHLKLAWTRELLKLRTELADVFTLGDYQPLQVTGPHSDHIIAFARRRGRDAAIVAVAKSFAPRSQGGRAWPGAAAFDGALQFKGYKVEGILGGATEAPLSALFRRLPVAVLKARFEGALKPVRKRMPA
jgi:(1->4)-alpha-D-glucan 1-alpha-D-glucosylmutase